jgi:hypothetical protein
MLLCLSKGDQDNPNGLSVSILQKALVYTHSWFLRHTGISAVIFAYPRVPRDADLPTQQKRIERLVWIRLLAVSMFVVATDILVGILQGTVRKLLVVPIIAYVILLQVTLILSLLRPLFGAVVDTQRNGIDVPKSRMRTPRIPAPRRSLLMALVNFLEILLAWALIYRCLMPDIVGSMDQANYFSVITLTTLGYGEINAGQRLLIQLAVTANMIVFLIFSICHVTTIIGAMSSGEDFPSKTNISETQE